MEDNSREFGQQQFTLPHDVVPLPSQGIFYKNKKKSVKVGYLTAADENIMMAGGVDMATNLIRNKLYEPDMRVEDMLEGDVEAILVFLRNTGFGPEITMTLTDPQTSKVFKASVSLEQLGIIQGQTPNEDGTFTLKLPRTGSTIKVKPLTFGEITEINKVIENYPQGRVAPKVTYRLNREIVEIDGSSDRQQISKFVESMPIMDSKFIRKFMDENEPRLDMRKEVIAPSGEKLTTTVGFGVEFFRPFF